MAMIWKMISSLLGRVNMSRTYRVPGHLDDDIGQHERPPRVCLRLPFSSFIQHPLDHKQEDENTEHLVLETLLGVVALEEGETNKERAADGEDSLGVDVRRSAPVLLGNAHANSSELCYEGCGESLMATIGGVRNGRALVDKFSQP